MIEFAEDLHQKKVFNLDTPARELINIAESFKGSSSVDEVAANVMVYSNYFVVTPNEKLSSSIKDIGNIKDSIKDKIGGGGGW